MKKYNEILTEIESKSFFNNLNIPNLDEFIEKKMGDKLFSYKQFKKESHELSYKRNNILRFIDKKVTKRAFSEWKNEISVFMSSLTEAEKWLFNEIYPDFNLTDIDSSYNRIESFTRYILKASFGDKIRMIPKLKWNDSYDKNRRIITPDEDFDKNWEYIDRILSDTDIEELKENLVDLCYDLQNDIPKLQFVLKRLNYNQLDSFYKNGEKLIQLIRLDTKHPTIVVSHKQLIQFAEFYLEQEDFRLNAENVVRYILNNLNKQDEYEYSLIKRFIFRTSRSFSSVISGEVTERSYGDNLNYFKQLLNADDLHDLLTNKLFLGKDYIKLNID